jgi:heme-degrading monooxygenase HmoA
MVHALITFDTTDAEGFAKAAQQGGGALEGAKGYHGMRMMRGIEDPARFLLMVDWDTKDDHMAWMAANETQFLGMLMPFLAGKPDIKHFT